MLHSTTTVAKRIGKTTGATNVAFRALGIEPTEKLDNGFKKPLYLYTEAQVVTLEKYLSKRQEEVLAGRRARVAAVNERHAKRHAAKQAAREQKAAPQTVREPPQTPRATRLPEPLPISGFSAAAFNNRFKRIEEDGEVMRREVQHVLREMREIRTQVAALVHSFNQLTQALGGSAPVTPDGGTSVAIPLNNGTAG